MSGRVLRFTGVLSAVAGVVVFQASGYGPKAAAQVAQVAPGARSGGRTR